MKWQIIISLILFSTTAIASEKAPSTLTLPQVIDRALAQNPAIAAAYYETKAAQARPPQAATPPDPQFMVQFTQVPINTTDVSQGMTEYMVEQQVPFPSKLVFGHKAEKHAAMAKQSREAMTAQEIVRRVKTAYLDAWRLQEETKINRQTMSIYLQNKGTSETAYATLERPVSDPVRASVDLGDIEGQLAMIEQEYVQAVEVLSSLIAEPIEQSVRIAPPPGPSSIANLSELLDRAKAVRPEIVEAGHAVDSEGARVSLAKSQYGPDLTFRWGFLDMPGNMQNAWTGRVGLTIPLWSFSKQRYGVRESQAMLMRARSQREETELGTIADVKSSYARLMAAKKVARIYSGTVIPRAQLLMTSSQEAYKSNKADFLGIVDSIRSLNNAKLMLVRAKTDEAKAYADLERAVGAPITKEGSYGNIEN